MRSQVMFVAVVLGSTACGGGGAPTPPRASGGGAPSASTSPSPSASAGPSTQDAGAPAASGRCLAGLAGKRPAGWSDAGSLSVTTVDGRPTKIGGKDASGNAIAEQPIQAQTPEDARRAIRDAVCRAGGLLGVLEGKPPKNGVATIAVVKPAKEDEAADVSLLCREPKEMPRDLDEPQKLRIAFEVYTEQLSSTKWRTWLYDMTDEVAHAADDAGKRAVKKKYGATLQGAPGASSSCWFAVRLKG